MPEIANLAEYLETSAAAFPDRTAVMDPDGTALTYRQLDDRASRVAAYLVSQGVRRGDRVGLVLPKNHIAVMALFGILKAGAAYVPVDRTSPAERIRCILSDCGVRTAFIDERRSELFQDVSTVIPIDEALRSEPLAPGHAPRDPDDLAYILYTSGSTGVPKGVALTHRNATSFVDWCSSVFHPTADDRFSSHAPFHFDLSILDIYVSLKHGASLHPIPEDLGKNPKELARFIAERRLTVWYSTPSILNLLGEFGDLGRCDCSSLRLVLFAGEVFPVGQLRRITGYWPTPEYFNLYGPTETNVCTFAQIRLPVPEDRTTPYPIGWPCAHCASLVIDAEGDLANPGEEGLLYISGPAVFSGYWGRPAESEACFIERYGQRWYNTGDVVKESGDGFLYVGRRDRMVKRRGYRIELGEVESCLHRHEAVSGAAAVAVPHPEAGVRIVAYLVAPEESRPSMLELKTFCNRNLPAYMNPDVFLFLPDLPRTSTAKTDYQALVRYFQESARV